MDGWTNHSVFSNSLLEDEDTFAPVYTVLETEFHTLFLSSLQDKGDEIPQKYIHTVLDLFGCCPARVSDIVQNAVELDEQDREEGRI